MHYSRLAFWDLCTCDVTINSPDLFMYVPYFYLRLLRVNSSTASHWARISRTSALELVVLTDCPPGPDDRMKVLRSSALVRTTSLYVLNLDVANMWALRIACLKKLIISLLLRRLPAIIIKQGHQINIIWPLFMNLIASQAFSAYLVSTYWLQPSPRSLMRSGCFSALSLHISTKLSMVPFLAGSQITSLSPLASGVTRHFQLYIFLARMLTSSISTWRSSGLRPVLLKQYWIQLYILEIEELLTQSVSKGSQGYSASQQSTQLAMDMPMIAGIVPSTGMMRIRQLSKTLKASGLDSCVQVRGRSSLSACWQEQHTLMPVLMDFLVSSRLRRMMSLSYLQSAISRICSLVGSDFMPAPPETISLSFFSTQAEISSTLASRLSMQSTMQSGLRSYAS